MRVDTTKGLNAVIVVMAAMRRCVVVVMTVTLGSRLTPNTVHSRRESAGHQARNGPGFVLLNGPETRATACLTWSRKRAVPNKSDGSEKPRRS